MPFSKDKIKQVSILLCRISRRLAELEAIEAERVTKETVHLSTQEVLHLPVLKVGEGVEEV